MGPEVYPPGMSANFYVLVSSDREKISSEATLSTSPSMAIPQVRRQSISSLRPMEAVMTVYSMPPSARAILTVRR
jgi:hypothetical protein